MATTTSTMIQQWVKVSFIYSRPPTQSQCCCIIIIVCFKGLCSMPISPNRDLPAVSGVCAGNHCNSDPIEAGHWVHQRLQSAASNSITKQNG